jgi:hypothetical protein
VVRPERFELPTLWFEAKCSIQLSYGRVVAHKLNTDRLRDGGLERGGWGGVVGFGEEGDGLDDV